MGTISVGNKAKKIIDKILESNRLSMGRYVSEFENLLASSLKIDHMVAVNTGTAAISVAAATLYNYGARPGDEIIVPALTFISTATGFMEAGFKPIFVDVDLDTLTIDPEQIVSKITPKTKAIIPVHLFGKTAPMDEILDIAHKYNLTVIEDAAEALFSTYKGKYAGTIGKMGCFSFYVAHIISTVEGGAVCTKDSELSNVLRSLRAHGRGCTCKTCKLNTESAYCDKRFSGSYDSRFHFIRRGFSAKMNELEAAIGLDQLSNADHIVKRRRDNLLFLNKYFIKYNDIFSIMKEETYETVCPLAYPIIIKNCKYFRYRELIEYLEKHNIETRPMFKSVPTQQPAFTDYGHRIGDFPNSEYIGNNGFYIGVHQEIEEDDLNYIIETVNDFLNFKFRVEEVTTTKPAIIIFTFNNEKDIGTIGSHMKKLFSDANIIFVDRGSKDNTIEKIKELNYRCYNLKEKNIYNIIKDKILEKHIIFFEAGGVQDINDIKKIESKLEEGYDLVVASRFMLLGHLNLSENIPFARGFGNRLFTLICNLLFNGNLSDSVSSFRGIKREHLRNMKLNSSEYDSFFRMTIQVLKMNLKIYEFETWERKRTSGKKTRNIPKGALSLVKIIFSELMKGKK